MAAPLRLSASTSLRSLLLKSSGKLEQALCIKYYPVWSVWNCTFSSCSSRHLGSIQKQSPYLFQVRYSSSSIFTKLKADNLWESVTSVSNAGKKKGRGRAVGRKKVVDLNQGQILGDGRAAMVWPGLNAPVIKNRQVVRSQKLPETDREQRLINIREAMSRVAYPSTPPLLRGFTGGRMVGMRYGAPDPIGDYTFEGFDSVLLELKHVTNMTGTLGRKRRYTAFVVTGNKNGMAGYGLGRGTKVGSAIRIAKNRAAQTLYHVPLFDNHTVYHNMFSQYHRSKIFIHKKEKGFGLRCHRVIMAICDMLGIKDLHCKVEGSTTNIKAITKGFLNSLVDQETHQALAERMGYHVVEFRPERDNLPTLIASPSNGQVKQDPVETISDDIDFDVERMYLGGKLEYKRKPGNPFKDLYSYKKGQKIRHKRRNQYNLHIQRQAGLI